MIKRRPSPPPSKPIDYNVPLVLKSLPQRKGLFEDQFGHWHYIPPKGDG